MSNYLISQADIIGRQPLLRINDMPRNQTLLGGSLCIIVYCFFILASLYFGQELVYKIVPKIIEAQRLTNENDKVYLSKDQFSFFISLYHPIYGFFNPNPFINLNLEMVNVNGNNLSTKNIQLGICDESDIESDENTDYSYKELDLTQFICMKNLDNNFFIEGVNKFKKYSYIKLVIGKCLNNCKTKEEIFNIIPFSTLSIFYFDKSFNFRKFSNFSSNIIRKFDLTFNYNYTKLIEVSLGLTKIYTDEGFMFEIFKKKELHRIKNIEKIIYDRTIDNDNLININFKLDYIKTNVYRKYYKIQNWVAELGGIIRAMTLIASMINYFNDRASFYEMLINKLFDVDDIIKYFQFNDLFISKQSKRRKRDSIVLRNAKKEKDYFEKGESRFLHNITEKKISPHQTNNFLKKPINIKNSSGNLVKDDTFGLISNPINYNITNKDDKSNPIQKNNNNNNKNNNNNNNNNIMNTNSLNNNCGSINNNIINTNSLHGNYNNNNNNISIISSNNDDEREIFIDNLKKNPNIKEHFEKVRSNRFTLSGCEALKFYFKNDKENPKYNSFIGGRELLRERTDLIYILKKNLELDRFKNLILRDNQLVLLNSLTKFMLDPERVNLVDFETCSYEKFIDCYDNVAMNSNMIDLKLAKWVETKFKFEQHSPSAL